MRGSVSVVLRRTGSPQAPASSECSTHPRPVLRGYVSRAVRGARSVVPLPLAPGPRPGRVTGGPVLGRFALQPKHRGLTGVDHIGRRSIAAFPQVRGGKLHACESTAVAEGCLDSLCFGTNVQLRRGVWQTAELAYARKQALTCDDGWPNARDVGGPTRNRARARRVYAPRAKTRNRAREGDHGGCHAKATCGLGQGPGTRMRDVRDVPQRRPSPLRATTGLRQEPGTRLSAHVRFYAPLVSSESSTTPTPKDLTRVTRVET